MASLPDSKWAFSLLEIEWLTDIVVILNSHIALFHFFCLYFHWRGLREGGLLLTGHCLLLCWLVLLVLQSKSYLPHNLIFLFLGILCLGDMLQG